MRLLCILLVLAACSINIRYVVSQQCEASSVGTHFVFGMIGGIQNFTGIRIHLHITPVLQQPTHVRVTAPYINMNNTYTVSNYTLIPLNGTLMQYESGQYFKGIEVSSDVNISLAVMTGAYDIMEGFLALPVGTLGTRYTVASYVPYDTYSSEVLIAGVENDTNVFLSTVIDGHQNSTRTFRLQKLETYQLKANNDVSGSVVISNKPVAVFSGSAAAKVLVDIGDYQYLVEQMIPTKYWTTQFIVPSIYPRKYFALKLFADYDNTEVHYYYSTKHFAVYMNNGSMEELLFGTDPVVVLANKPISVIQYGRDGDHMEGDPFMANTQGIAQFQNSYKFVTQNDYPGPSNTIAITILKNSTSGLLLNGQSLPYLNAKNVSVSPPMDQYITLFIDVSNNSYYHLHHSGGIHFGAVIYGRPNTASAYGYPLQLTLIANDCKTNVPISSPTTSTVASVTTALNQYSTPKLQNGRGPWCFHCEGMSHLRYCDKVSKCQTENEVCYVQRYIQRLDEILFRSGCTNPQQCNVNAGSVGCFKCCDGSFCNSAGCGDEGFPAPGQRGPVCFDCTHKGKDEECYTLQLCHSNQVCMIEKYEWGDNDFNYIRGCTESQVCSKKRSAIGHSTRRAPVCSHCCHSDFCNMNCTSVGTIPGIIEIPLNNSVDFNETLPHQGLRCLLRPFRRR